MILREYRIPVPFTTAEYQIAQLYSVAEASKNETGDGEGVQVLKNEPYKDENGEGQYTHKIYHLSSKVPNVIRMLAPNGSLEVHEEAWNAFPYCRTVMTSPYMKNNFKIEVTSQHIDQDISRLENVHQLGAKDLDMRQIVNIDIANDHIDKSDYREAEDPRLFTSEKTGRGPLDAQWLQSAKPIMTCYKLVRVEFKWLGLQGTVESMIHRLMKSVFTRFHRLSFCLIDKWIDLTLDDIRNIEDMTTAELDVKRKHSFQESSATSPNEMQADERHTRAFTQ